jgi:hypothetical protein
VFERLGQMAVAVDVAVLQGDLPSLRLVENVCGHHGELEQLQLLPVVVEGVVGLQGLVPSLRPDLVVAVLVVQRDWAAA